MIMTIMMSINIMMMFMKHPLSMGMLLIIQSMCVSMITGLMMNSFWMSYILLITMLSGMLVLFIYMSSIASNEKFMINITLWLALTFTLVLSSWFLFLKEKMIIKNNYLSMEILNYDLFPMNKMFDPKNMYIIILMVSYLLFTMITSTHLISIFEGPMRMKT
uniref:NADH-ubiquinone oxidoreductase chain 6 n=1 Tax=Mystilus priamus TaxID=2813419 RepID=A0A8T9ZY13_9HEMI|nr:NADH dehydrogenase subunit 6 [Mystilus priamus]